MTNRIARIKELAEELVRVACRHVIDRSTPFDEREARNALYAELDALDKATDGELPPLPESVGGFSYNEESMRSYASAAIAPYKAEVERLRATLETTLHAFAEIHHASTQPDWFTHGQEGATKHRIAWEGRCIATIKAALKGTK